jgi:hypothetical protein
MCKEMLVILVNKVVDPKRIISKNGGPRRRRGTRGRWPPQKIINKNKKGPHSQEAGFAISYLIMGASGVTQPGQALTWMRIYLQL